MAKRTYVRDKGGRFAKVAGSGGSEESKLKQLLKSEKSSHLIAGLTNRQMVKAIKGGFYSGDDEGFIEDMQMVRKEGRTIQSYYKELKKKGFI